MQEKKHDKNAALQERQGQFSRSDSSNPCVTDQHCRMHRHVLPISYREFVHVFLCATQRNVLNVFEQSCRQDGRSRGTGHETRVALVFNAVPVTSLDRDRANYYVKQTSLVT